MIIGRIVRTTIEKNPVGKRSLEMPRLRWEDCLKVDVGKIQPKVSRGIAAGDKDGWREMCLAVWSQ